MGDALCGWSSVGVKQGGGGAVTQDQESGRRGAGVGEMEVTPLVAAGEPERGFLSVSFFSFLFSCFFLRSAFASTKIHPSPFEVSISTAGSISISSTGTSSGRILLGAGGASWSELSSSSKVLFHGSILRERGMRGTCTSVAGSRFVGPEPLALSRAIGGVDCGAHPAPRKRAGLNETRQLALGATIETTHPLSQPVAQGTPKGAHHTSCWCGVGGLVLVRVSGLELSVYRH